MVVTVLIYIQLWLLLNQGKSLTAATGGELDHTLSSVDLALKNNLPNVTERIRPQRDIMFSILMLAECLESDA